MSEEKDKEEQHLKHIWRGIAMTITYKPHYANNIAHLAIETETRERLPITETGYRSHFTAKADVEAFDNPIDYVEAMLNEAAQSKAWKKYETDRQQLKLF